jgi:dephospho-CoA kinase
VLRVGLTGGLGSGKSTVAGLFARLGAHVLEADELGRQMMLPGEPVYAAVIAAFGDDVVLEDGRLDRSALARMAFSDGRVDELNAIVHPAVIGRQAELVAEIAAKDPTAVVIVESALIFETAYDESGPEEVDEGETGESETLVDNASGWRRRFDRIVLVTAPEELKVARYVARTSAGRMLSEGERAALEDDAHRRLERQIQDEQKVARCDYVLSNVGSRGELQWKVDQLWPRLQQQSKDRVEAQVEW